MDSLTIINDTVEKAYRTIDEVETIKWKNTKVWPQPYNPGKDTNPFAYFTADNETALRFVVTPYEYGGLEYSYDNEEWTFSPSTVDIAFGGDKGPVFVRTTKTQDHSSNAKILDHVEELTDIEWKVGGSASYLKSRSFMYRFEDLFKDCTHLVSAAEFTLDGVGYHPGMEGWTSAFFFYATRMFQGCTRLKDPPRRTYDLYVGHRAFEAMFKGCSELQKPLGGALIMADISAECLCKEMYMDCMKLQRTMDFSFVTVYESACESMYENCKSLKEIRANKVPIVRLCKHCFKRMFAGCTSLQNTGGIALGDAYADGLGCCESMFEGCTSLTVGQLAWPCVEMNEACKNIYKGCTSLKSIFTGNWGRTVGRRALEGAFDGCYNITSATGISDFHPRSSWLDSFGSGPLLPKYPASPAVNLHRLPNEDPEGFKQCVMTPGCEDRYLFI